MTLLHTRPRVRRVSSGVLRAMLATGLGFAGFAPVVVAATATPAGAAAPATAAVYNSIPNPLPGNVPSEGNEAYSMSEFGDLVSLTSASSLTGAKVIMSSWGCQSGTWNGANCVTAPNATFTHSITLKVYAVDNSGPTPAPGAQLLAATQTFTIPYRPSADATNCTGGNAGKWYSVANATCYNGLATPITFSFPAVSVPQQVIYTVAYNTTHYGYSPIGEGAACFSTSGGCPYDSLNVATAATSATIGTDATPNGVVQYASYAGQYCDNGAAGTNVLRLDDGCWTGFNPLVELDAHQVASVPSTATVIEGTGGTTTKNIPVTLAVPASGPTTVDWATSNGTAKAPSDYTATAGTLSFAAGEQTKNITIQINPDSSLEKDETFTLKIKNPANTDVGNDTTAVTILNDEAPKVVVKQPKVAEGSPLHFTVTLKGPDANPLTLHYATSDNTAVAPGDYTPTSGDITIPAGTLGPQNIDVTTHVDGMTEGQEKVKLTVTGGASPVTVLGTILANNT